MKISFWSVGKAHEPMMKDAIEEFTKRADRYFTTSWQIIPSPKNARTLSPQDQKKKEAEAILALLKPDDYLVVLDERGRQMHSEGLAQFIQQRADGAIKNLVFLIGGAYGVDESVLKKAQLIWSLSQLVFPHQLVRLILAEQVYRACTILRNEKYHHS
jgi:23S rRNA (pseudouridine1915-N3)-methyltransferase